MKEFAIYYIGVEDGETMKMVGSGYGRNASEALADFHVFHRDDIEIVSVELYK